MINQSVEEITAYYKELIDGLHTVKDVAMEFIDMPDDVRINSFKVIPDILLYMTLIQLDLAICCKYMIINNTVKDHYEMQYFVRALTTHCADIFKTKKGRTLTQVKGVADLFKDDNRFDKQIKNILSCRSKIFALGKENLTFIEDIRNKIFAHRDGTGAEQHDDIRYLNGTKLVYIAAAVISSLAQIMHELVSMQRVLIEDQKKIG